MFWLFDSMPKSGFTPTLLYFLSYYFTFAPYASTFSLTLNRCLAAFSVRGGRQVSVICLVAVSGLNLNWVFCEFYAPSHTGFSSSAIFMPLQEAKTNDEKIE